MGGVADDDYRAATDRVLPAVSALQRSALNLLFNGVKAALGVPTLIMQKLATPPQGAADSGARPFTTTLVSHEPPPTLQSMIPKIRLSQVIDQGKEAEVPVLDDVKLSELRTNYAVLLGDAPMETQK